MHKYVSEYVVAINPYHKQWVLFLVVDSYLSGPKFILTRKPILRDIWKWAELLIKPLLLRMINYFSQIVSLFLITYTQLSFYLVTTINFWMGFTFSFIILNSIYLHVVELGSPSIPPIGTVNWHAFLETVLCFPQFSPKFEIQSFIFLEWLATKAIEPILFSYLTVAGSGFRRNKVIDFTRSLVWNE